MALAPTNTTVAYSILFLCIISWGSYAPLRRTSPHVPGAAFGTLAFVAEFLWACAISFTFGSITEPGHASNNSTEYQLLDSDSNFFQRLASDVTLNPGNAVLIVLGGTFVGFGDSVSFSVLTYVPSSLAFPLIVGTCTAVGTTISYIVDGSENPVLLFAGVALLIPSIVFLAWAQSNMDPVLTEDIELDTLPGLEEKTTTLPVSSPSPATAATTATPTWKWIVLLLAIGSLNSLWGPLSTVGRRNVSVHSGYFLLTMGRIGIQPMSQSLTQLLVFKKNPRALLTQVYDVPRRDKLCAFGCGLLIGLGYYSYFIGSNVVNKSAAFAISNCSPLWTICLGVCVQKDLQRYQNRAKIAVGLSTVCFIASISVLCLV